MMHWVNQNFPWLQLMFESADALEYLHSPVFLHNDIKTDNMLLTGDSSPLGNENVHHRRIFIFFTGVVPEI